MSKEGMIKHREVLNAWLDGAEVQYRNFYDDANWYNIVNPSWDADNGYRIKPQPKILHHRVVVFEAGHARIYSKHDQLPHTYVECYDLYTEVPGDDQ